MTKKALSCIMVYMFVTHIVLGGIMNQYTKIIGLTGTIYVKEFEKIKHYKNKLRSLREDTVAKVFKEGNAEIKVYFEETDVEIVVDPFSDQETIKKYLGKPFL